MLTHQIPSNTRVSSNQMVFDDSGVLKGFGKVIHSYNKNTESALRSLRVSDPSFAAHVSSRPHALVIGDSLGDLRMAEGRDPATTLTIGFLNDRVEERLEEYTSSFDVVLTPEAGSFDFVMQIISDIAASAAV
jgi:cytosolic 5'-nucleotidase 3